VFSPIDIDSSSSGDITIHSGIIHNTIRFGVHRNNCKIAVVIADWCCI